MLPRSARLAHSADFRDTIRRGVRVGRPTLVVHAAARAAAPDLSCERRVTRVGLVVSKAVGNAVLRNRVKRRLRHAARELVSTTPAGVDLVVRALPAAAIAPALCEDLAAAWNQAVLLLERRQLHPVGVHPEPAGTRPA